jgi:hypothetical protein
LRRTAASLIVHEEKLSISHIEAVQVQPVAAWSVYAFGLASPTMTHQPILEGGNGVIFDFARLLTSNLSLERWVETRVAGWGDELVVAD